MAQNQYFSLQYDSQEKLYVLSINDDICSFDIGDIYEVCNDSKVFSKGKNDEIIIHEPIKIKYNNTRKNIKIDFQHSVFKERVYFTNCEFNGNVFFNHAVFCKYADFHESIFNGIVSFYNATFDSAPNFSTCVFSKLQATNFINVKMDNINFHKILYFIGERINDKTYKNKLELLQAKCSKESKEYKEEKQKLTQKHRIRYASNARDSFRTIKNVLIANNNLLDASNWHKLELYAKEQELKLQNPKTFSKDWCDKIQLCFYRHTSAHHTDLLKILSCFVILVGVFTTILFFEKEPNNEIWCSSFWIVFCVGLLLLAIEKISCLGFFALLNLVPCAWLLTWNPKYIFGVANLFTNDKCQSDWFFNLILSLYSILFILVIFSLQKTARKNSIIPN